MVRKFLENSVTLYAKSAKSKGSFSPKTFDIDEMISASGTNVVCYSAKYKGDSGTLREFYPLEIQSLARSRDGQLIPSPVEAEKFGKLVKKFTAPYKSISDIIKTGELSTFIPQTEIYYSQPFNGGTAYIWSPKPDEFETFENICEEIHKAPGNKPELKLLRILGVIESLTKCMGILYENGFILREIKPSDFGFEKRKKKVTRTVALLDIDNICPANDIPDEECMITEESGEIKADNRTDIYSIGATLFFALTGNTWNESLITDSSCRLLSRDEISDKLKKLIDNSKLISSSDMNSNPNLRHMLTTICSKTFCRLEDRYDSCEDLLEDIRNAAYYLLPAEISLKENHNLLWYLTDKKTIKTIEAISEKSAALVFRHHLYTHTLYEGIDKEKRSSIDLLVIGFGNYGQKFTDIALQICQIPGFRLNVTIISDSGEDKELYLSDRPALGDFFNIDGALANDPESYGDLNFITHEFSVTNSKKNEKYLKKLFEKRGINPDRAVVATGSDENNLFIAETAAGFCPTSMIVEGKKLCSKDIHRNIMPVYLRGEPGKAPLQKELEKLERMAFNVHLIWNKHLNVEFADIKKDFRDPYNHNSCVSFVLTMKYVMFAIGIDFDSLIPAQTAHEYYKYINHESCGEKTHMDDLVYYEHRRWVTEKLCLGYRVLTDYSKCFGGDTKDKKLKEHICLLRSMRGSKLSDAPWSDNNKPVTRQWNDPSEADLAALDDLEKMSVNLHIEILKYSKKLTATNLFEGNIVGSLLELTEKDSECYIRLKEYITCMKDIFAGQTDKCPLYKGLKNAFLDSLKFSKILDDRDKNAAKMNADLLHESFYPILGSIEYRDFKKDDVNLVKGVPFILTYSEAFCTAIPFTTGNKTDIFRSLASPTVLNPAEIIYFCWCKNVANYDSVKKSLPYISTYMDRKKLRAKIKFILGYSNNTGLDNKRELVNREFSKASDGRIAKVKLVQAKKNGEFIKYVCEQLKGKAGMNTDILLENNETIEWILEIQKLHEGLQIYSYDIDKLIFKDEYNCAAVRYIPFKPYITAADMFSLSHTTSTTSNKPEFFGEYQKLWELYRKDPEEWKLMCKEFAGHKNIITNFFIQSAEINNGTKHLYEYIIPIGCRRAFEKILKEFKNSSIILNDSSVSTLNTNSCTVTISSNANLNKPLRELFMNIDKLMNPQFVSVKHETTCKGVHKVCVTYNSLTFRNIDISGYTTERMNLLKALGNEHMIVYDKKAQIMDITFATPQIKELLTTGGKMLEVYVYHCLRQSGNFNDIRSGYEIKWEDNLKRNELDCVVTQGFSSIFIECKATNDLDFQNYVKLFNITKALGINARGVMIIDTNAIPKKLEDVINNGQNLLNIITITDHGEIDNIGKTLNDIMERIRRGEKV